MSMTTSEMAAALGRRGGLKGGPARAKALNSKKRSAIARLGGLARQAKRKKRTRRKK